MKVLIVDDDPVSRLVVEAALISLGHECLTADGGEAGWKLFLEERPDVVISDWMMPDLNGLELCRRIRSNEGTHYCSFVVLTSLDDKQSVREGILAGADDYLTKPLKVDELELRLITAARLNALHTHLADQQKRLEALNEELKLTARIDTLTGLGNRLRLNEDLATLISRMRRYGTGCCVGILDLDGFKDYNDIYGHLDGDRALKAVAKEIAAKIRAGDVAYRFGGEEFVCLFPELSLEASNKVLERVRQGVEDLGIPHSGNPPLNVVTVSAGVSRADPADPSRPERIIDSADQALYRAKASGRNRVEIAWESRSSEPGSTRDEAE
jgi:two-component system, cell cycle response regulator